MRFAEFPDAFSGLPCRREDLTVEIHFQELSCEAIHHIDVLRTDLETARQARILHFSDELSIRIEYLYSLILAVRHPQLTFSIERESMCHIEFPGLFSFAAPGLDELAVLIEL